MTVRNSVPYTLSIRKTFQYSFYIQETNITHSRSMIFWYSVMTGQEGPQHVGASDFCNTIVKLINGVRFLS